MTAKFKISIYCFFLLLFINSNAQNFELGKVSVAELAEKIHPIDSSASAAIIFKKGKTLFNYSIKYGFTVTHEYVFRIKIYSKEGLSWANFKVPYYIGYEDLKNESVKFTNCVTYNLEDGNVVKTKLDTDGTFKYNVNQYWNEKSITMPNVKVGSVIEYKYVLKSDGIVTFPKFEMQYSIPVNYAEYKTEVPEFFIYKPFLTGYQKIRSESIYANGSQAFENEYNQSAVMRYQQINSTYSCENIPAIKEELLVDNVENYRATIYNELERTRFPDRPVKDYSITWEGVAKTIYDIDSFGKELNKQLYLVQDVKMVLKNAVSQQEKLDLIFNFVQLKMNWNGEFGYHTKKGVEKAYSDKVGNVAEINFILISMLKLGGINANPVLLSTVENGVPAFPNRTVFNYVIAAAEIEGKRILLDATHKFTTRNILPINTLNWTGRLIKSDGNSQEINLVPVESSDLNYNLMVKINSEGIISGKVRLQKKDYEAYKFREKYGHLNTNNYLDKLENDYGDIQISDYTIENKDAELSKPVVENFTFTTDTHAERIADKMFVNPMLIFKQIKNPFVEKNRTMPIYFGYPKHEKFNVNIEIPEGYLVESIPKGIKIVNKENVLLFSINTLVQGNKIQIITIHETNAAILPAGYYSELVDFYKKSIQKQSENIVLKKL